MAEKTRAHLREQRSKRTRQKIYDIAMSLFEERGFENVKVTDICDAANVSIGSFYHFYPSKEHLLLAYADALNTYFEKIVSFNEELSAAEALKLILHRKLEFLTHAGADICRRELVASVNYGVGRSLDLNSEQIYQKLEQILQSGVDSGEFRQDLDVHGGVSSIRYMLGGLLLRWCCESGGFDIYDAADQEISFFLSSIQGTRS